MTATRTLIGSVSASTSTLYVAFELSAKTWKLAMTPGVGIGPWVKGVPAGDWVAVGHRIAQAKTRFGLSARTTVVSCYEAGRDGFWIHRALLVQGVRNRVVDSASIEVSRRRLRGRRSCR